ncbi:SUKH-4 family immunity protein [Streptomyces sp. TRM68367]|uniref:SUKH-4 family immunity protein n=1 Tax=Streptomyces sp. TRM68367 TaxID=2758415 RepID=UPI00165C09AC|nr:SUKH-4 family immunity protein [Streptomyces sp. TRM68367]MBC9725534.1 SUKH-4 family immunity protein [Streptomyces sp. TRM68367]
MSTTYADTAPADPAGLSLNLPARLLDQEFGRGRVMRFEDVDFPTTLTHDPTRRFLRESGLPEDSPVFDLDMDVPLQTLAEYYTDEPSAQLRLPDRPERLIRLGHLVDGNGVVVDGTTGAVLTWHELETTLRPLATDISTLAFMLWLVHCEVGGRDLTAFMNKGGRTTKVPVRDHLPTGANPDLGPYAGGHDRSEPARHRHRRYT